MRDLRARLAHLALWQVSEPPTLFPDLYKAYYPAAEVPWDDGLEANFPLTEIGAGGFVNVPVLAWLFVPLGEKSAGWVFLGIGAAATAPACLLWPACCCGAWRVRLQSATRSNGGSERCGSNPMRAD